MEISQLEQKLLHGNNVSTDGRQRQQIHYITITLLLFFIEMLQYYDWL